MASLSRSFRAFSGWTDGERALADAGMGYAVTDTSGQDLVLYSLELDAIPSDATIDGIQLRVDAYKEETDGSGTLWVATELSWDSGSTYTSTAYKTANLTTTEATTTLGGPTNTWGRSWTRAELNTLRLRLRSGGSSVVDNPDWRVDYAVLTIFYTDSTTLYGTWSETLRVDDNYAPSRIYAGFEERVTVRDGRESPRSPQAAIAGDVADELQALPADWITATAPRNADTVMYVEITLIGGIVIRVCDDTGPAPGMQEGVIAWDTIGREGAAGVDSYGVETGFTVRNSSYQITAGGAPNDLASWIRLLPVVGSPASIYAQAYYSGAYFNRLLFRGTITSIAVGEYSTEFRVSQEDKEDLPIPAITITPTLFNYGTDEGSMPKGLAGEVVPVAFGRFDPSALRTDWPADNPLSLQNQGTIIGAAMGLKFPMVPIPLVADRYRIRTGATNPGTTVLQSLFGFGDKAAGIVMTNRNSLYTGIRAEFLMLEPFASLVYPTHLFTWDSDSERALPFVWANDAYLPQQQPERQWSGAGAFDGASVSSPATNAAMGSRLQTFYVSRTSPLFQAQYDGQWSPADQSKWLSPIGFNQYGGSPYSGSGGTPTSWFTTPAIANPRNALSTDLDSYVTIAAGQQLGLHFSGDGPSPITTLRVWVIYSGAQSGHAAKLWYRSSWRSAQALLLDLNDSAVGVGEGLGVILNNSPNAGGQLNAAVGYLKRQWSSGFGVGGDHRLTFMDVAVGASAGGDQFPYEPEVLITVTSGTLKVAHVFLEAQYRSDLTFLQTPGVSGLAKRRKQGSLWDKLFHAGSSVKAAQWGTTQPGVQKQIQSLDSSTVFITGRSKPDTSPATYTATASSLIEVAPDIGQVVIDVFGGDYPNVAKGSVFGSFTTARTILNAKLGGDLWALSPLIDRQSDVQDTLDQLAQNSMSFCRRQVSDTGTLVWRWFVDGPAPHTDDPNRLYRTDGFYFDGDTILRDSFQIRSGDISDMFSDFTLKWGLHQPTGEFAGTMFVNKDGDNLVTESGYRNKCANVTTLFGVRRSFVVEAPWVWREKIADKLLKWHVDSRRERRHLVEFSTGPNGLDLLPGHVIRFADSLSTWVKYPGRGASTNWAAQNWVVVSSDIESEPLAPIRVRVTAIETYQE